MRDSCIGTAFHWVGSQHEAGTWRALEGLEWCCVSSFDLRDPLEDPRWSLFENYACKRPG